MASYILCFKPPCVLFYKTFTFLFTFCLFFVQVFPESPSLSGQIAKDYVFMEKKGLDQSGPGQNLSWNPSRDSWLSLYVKVCGWVCREDKEVRKTGSPLLCSQLCYKCDCDVTCALYGTCCPREKFPETIRDSNELRLVDSESESSLKDTNDFLEYLRSNPNAGIDKRLDGRFQCMTVGFASPRRYRIFGISNCPETETDKKLRELCESTDFDSVTVESLLPVSDLRSGLVYKNEYCLKCWRKNEFGSNTNYNLLREYSALQYLDGNMFRKWDMLIQCEVFQGLYTITDVNKFVSAVLKDIDSQTRHSTTKTSNCKLELKFEPSENEAPPKVKECYLNSPKESEKCNGSIYNDELTSNLCTSISKPAYSVGHGHNLFCGLCNDQVQQCFEGRQRDVSPYVPVPVPSRFLLEHDRVQVYNESDSVFSKESTRTNETYLCPQPLEWLDDLDKCRLPRCPDGKILNVETGSCKSPISVIEGLGYSLSMVLVTDQSVPSHFSYLIREEVERLHVKMMRSGYLAVYMIVFGLEQSDEFDVIKVVKIQGNFVAKNGMKRDEFEARFLNYNFTLLLNSSDDSSVVTLVPEGFGVDYVDKMAVGEYTQGNPEDMLHLPSYKEENMEPEVMGDYPMAWPQLSPLVRLSSPRDFQQPMTRKPVLYATVGKRHRPDVIWDRKDEFIDMTSSLLCPFVEFDIKEISTTNETALVIKFYYKGEEKTINSSVYYKDLAIEGRKIKICIETFREEFQKTVVIEPESNVTDVEKTWMSAVKRHLTICCPVVSVICLLATSITYFIFSQHRTLSGLNTISLCLTLASAQLIMILIIELMGYIYGYICIAFGIALHYTSLTSFVWLGVCSLHAYSVFKDTISRQDSSQTPRMKHADYRVCTFGTSAVIVSVYICVCEIASDGNTPGYSDQTCFFDTHWSMLTVILSFMAPLAVVIIINVVLVVITVREMRVVRRTPDVRRDQSRDELLSYLILSTIMGHQWVLTLVAIETDSDVAHMAVAILVGLQGIFVFMAFGLGKTTRKMCRNVCFGEDPSSDECSARKVSHSWNSQQLVAEATDV